ncbi:ABC transporter permease [Pseudonocardiaceae bacterium YIM PH 21723]|nr:ABC transporter permease [Pseudonocardiaceae bacterium YIM PH 21723]
MCWPRWPGPGTTARSGHERARERTVDHRLAPVQVPAERQRGRGVNWFLNHIDLIVEKTGQHLVISLLPVLFGLIISLPLGWLAGRNPIARAVLIPVSALLYTIPSLAMFVFLPLILGTQIIDPVNVIVALTIYTVSLLVRAIADALSVVDASILAAATAMGYRPARRFLAVELPLAVPVLISNLRVATVSNISLATVGSVIGIEGLGKLFSEGFQRQNLDEIVTGVVLVVVLALIIDLVLQLVGRAITPWTRTAVKS